jgi:hypothetical protein
MAKKEEIKITSIRMPKSMWVKLRRLQEKGEIKSIHQACLDGLNLIIKKGG